MLCLDIFGLTFVNNIVIFEISIVKLYLITKFCEKMKMSKFGTKSPLFGSFWAKILKNYYHVWNQHHNIFQK